MNIKKLIDMANKAKENAYVPYSKMKVGAALITKNGKIYTGCNIENASFNLGICAERVAISKAISENEYDFEAIVIVCDSDKFCSPCGACRQFIIEFGKNIKIIMVNSKKKKRTFLINKLLPMPFELKK